MPKANQPEVRNLSVDVRVLHVDGRRMTKSFYRQIPILELIDPMDFSLAGNPWGFVVEQKAAGSQLRFAVWEQHGKLYKCPIRLYIQPEKAWRNLDNRSAWVYRPEEFPIGVIRDQFQIARANPDNEAAWKKLRELVQERDAVALRVILVGQLFVGS